MRDEIEVPWPSDPECELRITEFDGSETIWVVFRDPKHNDETSVRATKGEGLHGLSPIWHVDISEDGKTATVSPSIHAVGDWHSPNPAVFRIVESLSDSLAKESS